MSMFYGVRAPIYTGYTIRTVVVRLGDQGVGGIFYMV